MNTIFRSLFLALLAALAISGCATTSSSLANSAERLERASFAFQRDAYDDGDHRGTSRDARELAEEARDFQRTLSDRHADDRDVEVAFHELSRSYHSVRDEVERSTDRGVDRDFAAVTEAYLDVERAMNATISHDRVSAR